MPLIRTNVTIPKTLLDQVDEFAGHRGRSQYIAEAVAKQVRRDMQKRAFDEAAGVMIGKPGWMNPDEALAFAKDLRAGWDRQK